VTEILTVATMYMYRLVTFTVRLQNTPMIVLTRVRVTIGLAIEQQMSIIS
jgi:hypothetical protein